MSRLHPCGEPGCPEHRPHPLQHLLHDIAGLLQRRPDLEGLLALPTALDPRSNA